MSPAATCLPAPEHAAVNVVLNENDPHAAQWLRDLIAAGHLQGTVDPRSIVELDPGDCAPESHFFAGIGGWPLALAMAGWPADEPVWTGSCPCQPFSIAGRRGGAEDERHLWPEWHRLIAECRPSTIFGEQVESSDGRLWLDAVSLDLEALGYAVGASDLCAASIGAPHIRQRLYWVAYSGGTRRGRERNPNGGACPTSNGVGPTQSRRRSGVGGVADDDGPGRGVERGSGVLNREWTAQRYDADGCCEDGRVGDTDGDGGASQRGVSRGANPIATRSPWAEVEWLPCDDGKARPTQPGIFPLANGIPGRVGRLRAYGNAISPPLAAAFIRAVMQTLVTCPLTSHPVP